MTYGGKISEINRLLFLLFDNCLTDKTIIAHQAVTRAVTNLKEELDLVNRNINSATHPPATD